ncbi:efflux transporter outer membrane subunit [Paraburkholderia susongensis]|uniref:Efflux transporter, outer membrane factor (OMF) lipoprotein, NodT family n=1 Tax=Paraburkholderia susongensis TaxID=1515439 RepID=A0A1X7LGF2_9BURK|nr:efflux transporter outer membrane subunit [Paraburkholderia susongensis]SMG52770.1 efflux transporter, outer membrane factor (OMF) lipoprotein, NodT family [Paraburkholderia susongensis]
MCSVSAASTVRAVVFRVAACRSAACWLAAFGASAALCACAVGPDFHRPDVTTVSSYTAEPLAASTVASDGPGGGAQHFVPADAPGDGWWRTFGSPALNALVQQALDDSPTLAQARAKLDEAQQDYRAQAGGTLWPQVDANLSATREKIDPAALGLGDLTQGRSFAPFTLYSAQVTVSYTFDLFGANRRALEAVAAQVDYQQYELEAARLTVAGNVVTAAIRRASLARQIALTESLLALQMQQLDIAGRRYQAGGISEVDLLSQRTLVQQTRATLPPLRTQLAQTDHQLAIYLGHAPAELAATHELAALDLDTLVLPANLPLTLPSTLAQQRPDIRASEALLHQASANIGVATANMYPRITLSGSAATERVNVSDLLTGFNVWNFGAGLTQPLFHGGELLARKRSSEAAWQAALAVYKQTVLQGLQQVADALRALDQDAIALQALDDAHRSAQRSAGIASERYAAGGISQLTLLDTQRQELQTGLDRTKIAAQRYADTAALYQALGARP